MVKKQVEFVGYRKKVSQLMSNTTTLQETTIHNVTVAESEEPTKDEENSFDIMEH